MKAEDLFLAIGGVDSRRLAATEAQQSSVIPMEATEMNVKNPKKLIRNLILAAIIVTILTATAYAAVNARIRMKTTNLQNGEIVETPTEGNYQVEVDFQKTTNEYLELGSVYPQSIPAGCELRFVSDTALGQQTLWYSMGDDEEAIFFSVMLGSDGGQFGLNKVASTEEAKINSYTGTLYTHENGSHSVVWEDETQGFGFVLHCRADLDALAIARSVGPGKPLTPTLATGCDTALAELGDYRITALPDGFTQTDFMASPLEQGGGWYAYVRRWYGDKVTTDSTIYFEYEHFALESDEPMNHPIEPVENTPETRIRQLGGGEATTILGLPGAVNDDSVIWVDWDAQTSFRIYAPHLTNARRLALAESVKRFN